MSAEPFTVIHQDVLEKWASDPLWRNTPRSSAIRAALVEITRLTAEVESLKAELKRNAPMSDWT